MVLHGLGSKFFDLCHIPLPASSIWLLGFWLDARRADAGIGESITDWIVEAAMVPYVSPSM